jgi:23S rRNA (pseudouridine1915-N3)-methyltransferase
MRIRLLWVGRTKEPWAREAIEKYVRLIRPYAEVEVIEVRQEKSRTAGKAAEAEGRRILEKASSFVLLDERGPARSSMEFSDMLRDRARVELVIGGPWGVSDEVRERAEGIFSLSKMTLTHDMARIVLLEQIYRGFTIITGKGYHH